MKNLEIARLFNAIAGILEVREENVFRIRAYRKAALNLESLTKDIETLSKEKKLEEIAGVGKDLAEKIDEYLAIGKIGFYEELKKKVGKGVLEMMAIPGIGPKTAKLLSDKLKIKSVKDLEKKARHGKLKGLPGIKEKTVENILRGIGFVSKAAERTLLANADRIAGEIVAQLKKLKEVKKIQPAGSLRRRKETVRDIDILITSAKPARVMDVFTALPQVESVLAKGHTKSSVLTKDRIQVDLRVVEPASFGAALAYFTGSKEHNVRLREKAVRMGYKINEYGIFSVKTGRKLASRTEEDMYKAMGMSFVPPEMREDRGEIELALKRRLPKLVEPGDIKGDLHVHSRASDGNLTIAEIAEICREKGYEYAVISEHSKSLKIAGGLSEKELAREMKEIERVNRKYRDFRLLVGTEMDILSDGSLDYKDSVLEDLDFVIAAIHSGFKQGKEALTKRIVKAMENRHVDMIAHLTGRLMQKREGYELDMDKVFDAARDTGTALEINAYPERLDLDDINCKRAKEMGIPLGIATDAHSREQFDYMSFGVSVARRGWLEKSDVINTLPLDKFLKKIKRK